MTVGERGRSVLRSNWARAITTISTVLVLCTTTTAQDSADADLMRRVDAAATARFENVLGFSAIEHYAVYRGEDLVHPAAEMTVQDTYKKGVGKTYTVISQSGSSLIWRFGLRPLLDKEQTINQPGNIEKSWFTSANYAMKLKPGGLLKLNGRDCFALDIAPKQLAPNLIVGTMWVDAHDGTLVQIDGVASKNPSAFSGTTHMMRQYANINGYSMAMHARAESDSTLFGRTVVTIDYSNYNLDLKNGK